jgi:putative endonuclease
MLASLFNRPFSYLLIPFMKMFYVYLLRSQSDPTQVYTGFTEDLRQRFKEHNDGKSPHTAKYLPWVLETYVAFSVRTQALAFERYLKTASGIAFSRKRLRPGPQSVEGGDGNQ